MKSNAGKKWSRVKAYTRKDGTKVKAHCKSTYNKKKK